MGTSNLDKLKREVLGEPDKFSPEEFAKDVESHHQNYRTSLEVDLEDFCKDTFKKGIQQSYGRKVSLEDTTYYGMREMMYGSSPFRKPPTFPVGYANDVVMQMGLFAEAVSKMGSSMADMAFAMNAREAEKALTVMIEVIDEVEDDKLS